MKTILQNDFASVWVYPDKRIIHHQFHKFMYGDLFRDVLLKSADAFALYGCTKWLSDDRKNAALKKEDLDWAYSEWQPKMMKTGWKHWAIVLPELVVGKMNMRQISDHYKQIGVNVQFFTTPEEGMQWLEQQ